MHAKVTYRYVEEFCDAGMSREYAEAGWAHYRADGTDMRDIKSMAEQRAFARNLDTEPASNVPEGLDEKTATGTLRYGHYQRDGYSWHSR